MASNVDTFGNITLACDGDHAGEDFLRRGDSVLDPEIGGNAPVSTERPFAKTMWSGFATLACLKVGFALTVVWPDGGERTVATSQRKFTAGGRLSGIKRLSRWRAARLVLRCRAFGRLLATPIRSSSTITISELVQRRAV